MKLKNMDILPFIDGIRTIEDLRLGGVRLKKILKNKRMLIDANIELQGVKKKLIDQYTTDGKLDEKSAEKEWFDVLKDDAKIEIEYVFNEGELDQFSDLTLAQYEILEMMTNKEVTV